MNTYILWTIHIHIHIYVQYYISALWMFSHPKWTPMLPEMKHYSSILLAILRTTWVLQAYLKHCFLQKDVVIPANGQHLSLLWAGLSDFMFQSWGGWHYLISSWRHWACDLSFLPCPKILIIKRLSWNVGWDALSFLLCIFPDDLCSSEWFTI